MKKIIPIELHLPEEWNLDLLVEKFASVDEHQELKAVKAELKETKRQLKLASSFHENCVMESPEYKKLSKEALSYRAALKIIGYNMSISWSKCVNTAQEALVK